MNFGQALDELRIGKKLRRKDWNESGHIQIQNPDENSKMNQPYIYLTTGDKKVPWIPTQADLVSDDWDSL